MTERQPSPADAPGRTLSPELLHDLRTPLNQIIGYSELLTEQAEEDCQSGFVPDLLRINTAGRRLLHLLNDGLPSLQDATPRESKRSLARKPDNRPPEPHTGVAPEQSAANESHARILVVDDNEANLDMLSRRLEREGYAVATAENGRQAIDAARVQEFDLVLLDIMMPEMDGYEALKQLKADELLHHIPIIMISALDELDSVVRCIEMGAEDYLPKPFEPTLLKARIGACLEKKRSRDREKSLFEQLQQNYKQLQELEKLRDDLTNMIVHDLRTPLTSVISGMQTLEAIGDLNAAQEEVARIALAGGENLLGMINELLDVEKMESGEMQLDVAVFPPGECVANALHQVVSLAASSGLTIVSQVEPGLPEIQGDADKLCRTLVNLLGNAIKFTPAGGTITAAVKQCDDLCSLLFSVSDTGEGIPAEAFERIFEKFGQVESRKRGRKLSTGLGLAFCKLAVEAHGGTIRVDSVPDRGSTFSFTIPLQLSHETGPSAVNNRR